LPDVIITVSGLKITPLTSAINTAGVRSEKQIHRQLLADLERVNGKMQITLSFIYGTGGFGPMK
jgi:hypothetical protein